MDNAKPGGNPVHGLTPAEEEQIVAVFDEWADIDRHPRARDRQPGGSTQIGRAHV